MKIQCKCGQWHDISPTGLAIVVAAFQDGDLTHVHPGTEVATDCILRAFDDSARLAKFHKAYKGNIISVNGERK